MTRLTDKEIQDLKNFKTPVYIHDSYTQIILDYEVLARELELEIKGLKDDVRQCQEEYSWIDP